MKILGVIPARFSSTRFPGKPLALIHGKPMIQRVYEQALKCKALTQVVVATDDQRIQTAVKDFQGKVVMTSNLHVSGTDRCNEVTQVIGESFDVVINIQGDEPFIHPDQIAEVAQCFTDKQVQIATLAMKQSDKRGLGNPNVVKVTRDKNHDAIGFSRSPIDYFPGRNQEGQDSETCYLRHIGIYGYRTEVLKEITSLQRSAIEIAESLEQLRWLENGYKIRVETTELESLSIDTPEDLERALLKIP